MKNGNGKSAAIPKGTLPYLVFCGLIIAAFLLVGIYPYQKSINDLDKRIKNTRKRIEEQKLLYPVYAELLGKSNAKAGALPPPDTRTGLAPDQVGKVPALLGDAARKSGVDPIAVMPDPKSLAGGSGLLAVQFTGKGDFSSLKSLLLNLGSLPYMHRIEEMQVQDGLAGYKDFKLKMNLAVKR